MKKTYIDKNGYPRKKIEHSDLVHRQRAYYGIYLPNKEEYQYPFSYYEVHHKDGDKMNNKISNLAILTPEEHDKEHDFFNKYGVWKEPFYRKARSLARKFHRDEYKISTIWFRINREVIRHFKEGEARKLAENFNINDYDFKQFLDLKLKELSEVSWRRVQEKLRQKRREYKKKKKKKGLGNKFFNKEETYSERLNRIRKKYPNAYESWSGETDKILLWLSKKSFSIEEISKKLKRQPSAIRSRLQKLDRME